jgi:hypothetical protein
MREEMCEVFYQYNSGAQFTLFLRRCNFVAILICDVQNILRARANGLNDGARDIGVCQREGVGEFIEKAKRVRRINSQDGVSFMRIVIYFNGDRQQKR